MTRHFLGEGGANPVVPGVALVVKVVLEKPIFVSGLANPVVSGVTLLR